MRRNLAVLAALVIALAPIFVLAANWFPVGYAYYDDLSTSKTLASTPTGGVTLPSTAVHATFTVVAASAPVCFSWAGGTATTNHECYAAGEHFKISESRTLLTKVSFIQGSAGAKLRVTYFSN